MKSLINSLRLGCLCLFAGATLATADEIIIKTDAPWKKRVEDGHSIYSLDTAGTKFPGLYTTFDAKPNTYYRVTWQAKASAIDNLKNHMQVNWALDETTAYNVPYILNTEWSAYTLYCNSEDASRIKFRIYMNPGFDTTVSVKDVEVTEVTPEMLGKNLVLDGDFEKSVGIPVSWKVGGKQYASYPASIEPSKDFISGEKCMMVPLTHQGELDSCYLPGEPGKRVILKFWAKADSDVAITPIIQGYFVSKHTGAHFYKPEKIKLTPDWKEYEISADIPTDVEKYPDLAHKLIYICLGWDKGLSGNAYFDEISVINQ